MARAINPHSWPRRFTLLTWLIGINIFLFLLVKIISLAGNLSGNEQWGVNLLRFLELPANPAVFITRPWTFQYVVALLVRRAISHTRD